MILEGWGMTVIKNHCSHSSSQRPFFEEADYIESSLCGRQEASILVSILDELTKAGFVLCGISRIVYIGLCTS